MLTANCQMLCDSADRVSADDPQVHDPQEFNPVSSMTSVTLQGWFGGVVFARNVQHWPIRQEGESGYTPGEDRWLARRTRIRNAETAERKLSRGRYTEVQSAKRFPIKLPISVKSKTGESHT